jgi:hypothetical protein
MLIKRQVFEKMLKKYKKLKYIDDTGALIGATRATNNVIIHTDFEVNTNYDIDCYGQYNRFVQCDTSKIVIMRQQAKSNTLDGGTHQSVYCEVNSVNNILKDFIYGAI